MKSVFALPGTMCTEQVWQALMPLLEVKGHQLSHIPIPENENLTDIMQSLADQLPKKAFSLMGFSLGGYLACLFASTYPERVSQLTIISNSPCALSQAEQESRAQTLNWLGKFNYNGIHPNKAKTMLDNPEQKWVECIRTMDAQLGSETLKQQLSATTFRDDLAESLSRLTIPLRFVISQKDPLVNQNWLQAFKQIRPSTSMVFNQGRSHMIPLEYPEIIADLFQS